MAHARETFKLWAGSLLEVAAPWIRRDLDTDRHSGRFVKQKRWILYARTARARVRGDASALQKSLHHEIVDQLAKLAGGGDYGRLIEVGCGAGRVLEHCASAVPEVSDFIGVDINSVIIARDGAEYAQNPRLQFLAADASVWLQQTAQPGTILLTHGGVMEYFSAETLSKMFKNMALHHPAAVALVEPVDPDHDLAKDAASHAFGQENSFSHNYEKLLQAAGFEMIFRKTLCFGGTSWVMLLATAIPHGPSGSI